MEVDYSDYYYNRKPKKRQGKWGGLIVILIFVLCFSGFMIAYNGVESGNTPVSVNGTSVKIARLSYYAVEMGGFSAQKDAESRAKSVAARGGAGYVYRQDAKYFVLAALYIQKSQAESVAGKLTEKGEIANVLEISLPGRSIGFPGEEEAKCARDAFVVFHNTVYSLLELSVGVDDGSVTEADAVKKIEELKQSLSEYGCRAGEKIKAYSLNSIGDLDRLCQLSEKTVLSREIKCVAIKALESEIALAAQL